MTDTKIKIIGKDYDVKFVYPYAPEMHKLDLKTGERALGLTMYFEDAIYIVNDLSEAETLRVLRHELTHAVIHETQFTEGASFDEEAVCELMARFAPLVCEAADKVMKGE